MTEHPATSTSLEDDSTETGNINVAVRIRSWPNVPDSSPCILHDGNKTLSIKDSSNNERTFTVDYVFDSADHGSSRYATQENIYSEIGSTILKNSLQGFNGCLFAYGQTGSGKSYTMHGQSGSYSGKKRGIIPRLSRGLFDAGRDSVGQLRMWLSYPEIYNEHLRDLLAVDDDNRDLTVMEHPGIGVYVRDLTEAVLQTPEDVEKLLQCDKPPPMNAAKINIDRNEQVLQDLQLEIGSLRRQLQSQKSMTRSTEVAMLTRELKERERLVADMRKSYESQLEASKEMLRVREAALADMGLSSSEINAAFGVGDDTPYMLNVSQDPMLSGSLIYYFQTDATTTIGSSPTESQMVLRGIGIPDSLCQVINEGNKRLAISLTDVGAQAGGRVLVNGRVIRPGDPPRRIRHLDRLVFGRAHCMSLIIPKSREARSAANQAIDGTPSDVVYDDFVREIVHDDSSEAFQELRHYIEEVKNKLNEQQMAEFVQVLKTICPLVDEANDMSSELRPQMNFRFEVELIWDIYNSPARDLIVIRLLEFHKNSDGPEDGTNATVAYVGLELLMCESKVLCYWSSQRFRHQLDVMRDLYHRVQIGSVSRRDVETGKFFKTAEGRLLDAWSDEPTDVKTHCEFSTRASLNKEIEQMKESLVSSAAAPTTRRRSTVLHSITGSNAALVFESPEEPKPEEVAAAVVPAVLKKALNQPPSELEELRRRNTELAAVNASLEQENEKLRQLLLEKTASRAPENLTASDTSLLSKTWGSFAPSIQKSISQTVLPDAATSKLLPSSLVYAPSQSVHVHQRGLSRSQSGNHLIPPPTPSVRPASRYGVLLTTSPSYQPVVPALQNQSMAPPPQARTASFPSQKLSLSSSTPSLTRNQTTLNQYQRADVRSVSPGGKHEPRVVSMHVYPVGVVPRCIKSQREVSLASFGHLIETLFGGPARAMSYFDPARRGQVNYSDFAHLLAAVTRRDWVMTPKGRGHASHDTLFGCDDANLFANLDQGGKGLLTIQDFVYAHMCAHAWSQGMALPPPPR
ncbi:hypothetical protein FOL47_001988 [Perkinsus chesapeaki]|uniref:Kinesin motor domain-containing protein n=1 Tax=Perkinsus chesapeaki TaxID=330153 RepID=A0A7J6MHQ0_PERCH|nr:hypothetical protein FOL47_001988 [Perkinsus chesapeaki]